MLKLPIEQDGARLSRFLSLLRDPTALKLGQGALFRGESMFSVPLWLRIPRFA